MSMSDASPTNDSNVLRKVASLTLEKSNLDSKVIKPKFVPEKLDFKIYEKFEGQYFLALSLQCVVKFHKILVLCSLLFWCNPHYEAL